MNRNELVDRIIQLDKFGHPDCPDWVYEVYEQVQRVMGYEPAALYDRFMSGPARFVVAVIRLLASRISHDMAFDLDEFAELITDTHLDAGTRSVSVGFSGRDWLSEDPFAPVWCQAVFQSGDLEKEVPIADVIWAAYCVAVRCLLHVLVGVLVTVELQGEAREGQAEKQEHNHANETI